MNISFVFTQSCSVVRSAPTMCDKRPCDQVPCAKNACESLSKNSGRHEACDFKPCSTTCTPRSPPSPRPAPDCKACAPRLNWSFHPDLRDIKPCDRKAYRQCKIQKWLDHLVERLPKECYGHYVGRAHAVASRELNKNAVNRECMGDEFPHFLDRYVWRLWHGARLNMQKHGISLGDSTESFMLSLLREECEELFNERQIIPDPREQMSGTDTWVHEGQHCSSSRAGRDCQMDTHGPSREF